VTRDWSKRSNVKRRERHKVADECTRCGAFGISDKNWREAHVVVLATPPLANVHPPRNLLVIRNRDGIPFSNVGSNVADSCGFG
jgi:hypothetical protein